MLCGRMAWLSAILLPGLVCGCTVTKFKQLQGLNVEEISKQLPPELESILKESNDVSATLERLMPGMVKGSCMREGNFSSPFCSSGGGVSCRAKCGWEDFGMRDSAVVDARCVPDQWGAQTCVCRKQGECCRRYQWWPGFFCRGDSNVSCRQRCEADSLDMGPGTRTLVGECRPAPDGSPALKCYCEKEGSCKYQAATVQQNPRKTVRVDF